MNIQKGIAFVLTLLTCIFYKSQAQVHEILAKQGMQQLSLLAGTWSGDAYYLRGSRPVHFIMTENIQWKLDKLVLLFEGTGRMKDSTGIETRAFEALSLLSYDNDTAGYKFRVYLQDGKNAEVRFLPLGDNRFRWNLHTSTGEMKYEISIDSTLHHWDENGYFSKDDKTWTLFYKMALTKQER